VPDSLETYNGAVTAVATIFIAAFTIVLALVTGRQARLSRESIDLAREEFISTHRPKIIVYGLEFSGDLTEDKPVPVGFRYVNSGDTNAEITGFGTTIVRIIPPALPAGLEFRPQTMEPPIEVPSGMHGFRLTIDTIGADQIASFESVMYSENVICAGYVLYRDGNGTRRQNRVLPTIRCRHRTLERRARPRIRIFLLSIVSGMFQPTLGRRALP
jgi:hypothetical protein